MPDNFEELMKRHDGTKADELSVAGSDDALDADSKETLQKIAQADKAFSEAAEELLSMPVPSSLMEAIRNSEAEPEAPLKQKTEQQAEQETATVIPFPARRGFVSLAIAAGLATVIATNTQIFEATDDSPLEALGPAYAALMQQAMNTVASGEILSSRDETVSLMPVISFETTAGDLCREFMAQERGVESSGIACLGDNGEWALRAQTALNTENGSSTDSYRLAEGEDGKSRLENSLPTARELSFEEEQAAIQSGWGRSGR